jgi:probable rRNA maturation factor
VNDPSSPVRPGVPSATVEVTDDQTDVPLDPDRWARLASHALAARGVRRGVLSLTFVDEATIAELNAEHMGHEGPTDVLSFPLDADLALQADASRDETLDHLPDGVPLLLGDVVICPAVAARNAPSRLADEPHPGAPDHDGTLDAELALLVVHGVLHVLGMDHAEPEEAATMHAAEREVLATFAPSGPEERA